ncbi:UNVERIFIED_ORG: hypothetical protein J2X79_000231 [Arthrobacter globiformis]|nr:hypothetical protein [Arthrobacter globiformis]
MLLDDNEAAAYVPQHGPSDPVAGLMVNGPQGKAPIALDYLHAVHPDTGLEVVFTPGEALPEWAQDVQDERRYKRPEPAAKPEPATSAKGKQSIRAAQRTKADRKPPEQDISGVA